MYINIRAWLEGLGLGEYTAAFETNHVDGQVLNHLTVDDLKDIGVIAVGHRRKLLDAIAGLKDRDQPDDKDASAVPGSGIVPQHTGERRQVTVLFADLCEFTRLSSSIDSEQVHELLAVYFEVADGIIRDFGGTVDKHVGDSVMAVFGAPVSHGNDAERAVRAAVAIQEAMPAVSERIGRPLEAHIGIASGEVVASGVGPDSHYTVTGDSVNLAARLTDKAQAGDVFVSEMVRRSVASKLTATDMGEISVKGLAAPVRVYSVQGSQNSSDAPPERPFVGRLAETQQFKTALEVCEEAGQGQLFHIRGDAGIGKTRLANKFCRLAFDRGFVCHRSLILDFGVGKGQDPVRILVRSLLGVPAGDDLESRQTAARRALSEGAVAGRSEAHLNDLLDLPQSAENQAIYDAMDNLTRIAGKLETVVALARHLSSRHPQLIVFEDLHWADKIVLQQIAELGRGAAEVPIMIVLTSRIEGDPLDPAWRGLVASASFMTLDLGPLSPADAMGMAANFVDTTDKFVRTCIERAAGNPLFLEQLLRSAEETGEFQVPGTVQSIIQARLDRLPIADKSVVQAASVLGQRFALNALRHLINDASYDCSKLIAHQLVREQGEDFLFVHALVRDGVYGSLLRSRRNELHLAAAGWFADNDLPLRAEHLEQAGHEGAAEAYRVAAEAQVKALRLEYARRLVERGLALAEDPSTLFSLNSMLGDLLRELGEPERSIDAWQEALSRHGTETERCLALLGIAEAMRIVERIDEALGLVDNAQSIAEALGLTEILMRLHHLRGNLLFPKGDIAGCEAGHRQSIVLAKEIGSAEGEARGLGGLGDAAYMAGRMRTSHDMLSKCVEICHQHGFGRTEVANAAQVCQTKIYWLELRDAIELGQTIVEAARSVGHDRAELNAATACLFAATELSDWSMAERYENHVLALGERLGSVRFSQEAMAFMGVRLNAQGRSAEALSKIRTSIAEARELGFSFGGPRMLGHLSRITKDTKEQDDALAEAEAIIQSGCVGHNQPFFFRDAIEVMLDRGDWNGVSRYADALAAFPPGETLPWSEYYAARARGLAAWEQGARDDEAVATLNRLRDEAQRIGLVSAVPALDQALSIA
jgi:class 3 adenylate cyclase/tetratricopeptide (TPR) repeat protein